MKMAHMEYVLRLHSTLYEPLDHNISYYMWSNPQVPGMMLVHKYGLVQKPVVLVSVTLYYDQWELLKKIILNPIHAHELQI